MWVDRLTDICRSAVTVSHVTLRSRLTRSGCNRGGYFYNFAGNAVIIAVQCDRWLTLSDLAKNAQRPSQRALTATMAHPTASASRA